MVKAPASDVTACDVTRTGKTRALYSLTTEVVEWFCGICGRCPARHFNYGFDKALKLHVASLQAIKRCNIHSS